MRNVHQALRREPGYVHLMNPRSVKPRSIRPETRSYYQEVVQQSIEQIARHLDEATDLRSLAAAAGLSPFHFHRVFRGMVGETPLEFGRRLRMERAAWLLQNSERPVAQIAYDAGYETHEAFTRAFRGCYGASPSEFRRRQFAQVELATTCGVHFDADGNVAAFRPRETGGLSMDVEITELPALRVGSVRHTGPYSQISQSFAQLGAIAGPAGLEMQPGTGVIAIYYDDPESTPAEELRADAAIIVPEDVPMPPGLTEQRLPGGRYARTVHRGPYELLGDTWARLMGEWLPASGYRAGSGPSYEQYLNTPGSAAPEDLETVLHLSLA